MRRRAVEEQNLSQHREGFFDDIFHPFFFPEKGGKFESIEAMLARGLKLVLDWYYIFYQ
jgi:hypothetical protein